MKTVVTAFALAAALFTSGSAMAMNTSVIASDNFEGANAAGSSVAGSSGGTGWAGNWAGTATIVNPALAMQGQKALQVSTNNTAVASRTLNTTVSGDVLVSFQFQYSGILGNNDFLGFWFGNSNGPNLGVKANCGVTTASNTCTDDFFVRTNADTTTMMKGSNLVAGTNYTMFGHLYKTGGSTTYNHFDAWLNPTGIEMNTLVTPDMTSSGLSISNFNTIGFRSDNIDNNVTMRVDGLTIAAIPEPTSIALFGAALIGMAGLRRRRA